MKLIKDSTQKHIILLKLMDLYENRPDFGGVPIKATSKERLWLSSVGAVLKAIGVSNQLEHNLNMRMLSQYPDWAIGKILGHIGDAIEELKLELELDEKIGLEK